jgi:hypothetical protein
MTIGNVGKAQSAQFLGVRKLLLVPLTGFVQQEEVLNKLTAKYWTEVGEQVEKLEAGLGAVSRLYHEGTVDGGKEALSMLEQSNPDGHAFLKKASGRGAELHRTEDIEPLLEVLDLQRCLMIGLSSQKVMDQVATLRKDAQQRRYEAIGKNINDTLLADEVGLLIISPDHQVQFAIDIQVFYVAPPAFNDIMLWIRDRQLAAQPSDAGLEGKQQSTENETAAQDE